MLTTFIKKRAEHYNISEMSIVFGVLAVGIVFPVLMIGACLYYLVGLSSSVVVPTCFILWLGFVGWLWWSFVVVGRKSPNERVTTGELIKMQVLSIAGIGALALFTESQERQSWDLIGSVFAWVILGFHAIYFTLAWAMKARVPFRTYVMFAFILGIVLLRAR